MTALSAEYQGENSRRRFAKRGYMTAAPELYARQGDVSKISNAADILIRSYLTIR